MLDARILIVDDQEADARLMATMLAAAGYSLVTITTDPQAAAGLHRKHRYDLLILDILMPGLDGFGVMAAIKAIDRENYVPVIVVTADPDHLKRALETGARDFISKPVRLEELRARVHNVLELGMLLRKARARGSDLERRLDERTADLEEAEGRFRALVEQSIAGIYIVEGNRFTYANPRMCEWLGYAAEELREFDAVDLVVEEDREHVLEKRRRRDAGDIDVLTGTYRIRRRDGSLLHLRASSKMIEHKGRKVIFGVAEDVTAGAKTRAALERANERLRILSRRFLAVQEEERRAISNELHDDVGQSLVALRIGLHRLAGNLGGAQHGLLAECIEVVDAVQDKLREISVELHPPQLDQLGLPEALRWLVTRHGGMTGLAIECRINDVEGVSISTEVASACYRISQEALNNATRHSRASNIRLELESREGSLELCIGDDGVGFDELAKREVALQSGSLGLISMEERARLAGGRLKLHTSPGAGSRVVARFPLDEDARAAVVRRRAHAPLA